MPGDGDENPGEIVAAISTVCRALPEARRSRRESVPLAGT